MRHARLLTVVCILGLAFCQPALAVTKEWSFALPENASVLQVVADDVGGVAVAYQAPSDPTTFVVWLNARGRQIYQRLLSAPLPASILGVNNRALVIQIEGESIVVVDRNGRESTVPNAFGQFPNFSPNAPTDRNGFFAVETSSEGPTAALVRYSY